MRDAVEVLRERGTVDERAGDGADVADLREREEGQGEQEDGILGEEKANAQRSGCPT